MAQILQLDKIGSLSQSSGTITLAASTLTIGGQQYPTGPLTTAVNTSVGNTRYMIYAIQSGGVVSLTQSTNVNSVGPAGSTSWKLVGAYYTNGLASVGFGSFVNIVGIPKTDRISYLPTYQGFGTPTSVEMYWELIGGKVFIDGFWANGTTTGVQAQVGLPMAYAANSASSSITGRWAYNATSTQEGTLIRTAASNSFLAFGLATGSNNPYTAQNANSIATGTIIIGVKADYTSTLSNTQLVDL